jgi:hypothetical protein
MDWSYLILTQPFCWSSRPWFADCAPDPSSRSCFPAISAGPPERGHNGVEQFHQEPGELITWILDRRR